MAEEVSPNRAQGWRSPVNALMLMSVANYLSFATWNALHTNFAIDAIHFDGTEMGILHTRCARSPASSRLRQCCSSSSCASRRSASCR